MGPFVFTRPVSRIEWVIERCRLLAAIGDEFEQTRPFEGLVIGTGIHLEPKTVALLEAVATGAVGPEACVVPVPRQIDEAVAAAFVTA